LVDHQRKQYEGGEDEKKEHDDDGKSFPPKNLQLNEARRNEITASGNHWAGTPKASNNQQTPLKTLGQVLFELKRRKEEEEDMKRREEERIASQ
jgi:hypothetical protein